MRLEVAHLGPVYSLVRLDGEHIIAPPWPRRPPGIADPDVSVLLHHRQHVPDGRTARVAGTDAELAEKRPPMVFAAPVREHAQALAPDARADGVGVGSGIVGVEILMRLEGVVAGRVGNLKQEVVARVEPAMRPRPAVAGDQDQVLRARLADGGYGGVRSPKPLRVGMSCGSFIRPNQTCGSLRNSAAIRPQKSAKSASLTSGPPITLP